MSTKSKIYIGLVTLGVLFLLWDRFIVNDTNTSTSENEVGQNSEEQSNQSEQTESETPVQSGTDKDNLIMVTMPSSGATVTSPIKVAGQARGTWFFEASFPIIVTDWDGLIIGEGHATADGEWMTEDFVPFSGTISYDLPADTPYKRGILIFKKDNPSGLPEHDDALEIPILFE